MSVFPDRKMGFVVLSNVGEFDTRSKVYAMADLFLKGSSVSKAAVKKEARDSLAAMLKDASTMRHFVGDYISDDGLPISISLKRSRAYYQLYGQSDFLMQDTKDTFSIASAPEIKFIFGIKAKDTTVDINTSGEDYHLKKYLKDTSRTDKMLEAYTGTYHSPELDCSYRITLKDHHLFLTNAKYNEVKLTLLNGDHLTNDNWWMSHLKMIRDSKNNINRFEVNADRIMHLRFNKTGNKD